MRGGGSSNTAKPRSTLHAVFKRYEKRGGLASTAQLSREKGGKEGREEREGKVRLAVSRSDVWMEGRQETQRVKSGTR
jgi:hypothetical protein